MEDDTSNRRGMELVRRLHEDERRLLRSTFEATKQTTPSGLRAVHLVNLYLNRAFIVEHPLQRELHAWVTGNVAQLYSEWPEAHILAYGFITNPAGNPDGQPFHCDYGETSS